MFHSLLPRRPVLLLTLLFGAHAVLAQTATASSTSSSFSSFTEAKPLPDAPSAQVRLKPIRATKSPYGQGGYAGPWGVHAACGGGLDLVQGRSQGTLAMCGAGFTLIPFSAIEFGGLRLQDGSPHFYMSEDALVPLTRIIKPLHGEPVGILGYTKIVGNSNRLDYGLAWEHHVGPQQSIGLEVRDYLQFTSPVQHAVVFRIALLGGSEGD